MADTNRRGINDASGVMMVREDDRNVGLPAATLTPTSPCRLPRSSGLRPMHGAAGDGKFASGRAAARSRFSGGQRRKIDIDRTFEWPDARFSYIGICGDNPCAIDRT